MDLLLVCLPVCSVRLFSWLVGCFYCLLSVSLSSLHRFIDMFLDYIVARWSGGGLIRVFSLASRLCVLLSDRVGTHWVFLVESRSVDLAGWPPFFCACLTLFDSCCFC